MARKKDSELRKAKLLSAARILIQSEPELVRLWDEFAETLETAADDHYMSEQGFANTIFDQFMRYVDNVLNPKPTTDQLTEEAALKLLESKGYKVSKPKRAK